MLSGTRLRDGARQRRGLARRPGADQPPLPQPAATAPSPTSPTRPGSGARAGPPAVCAGDYDNDGWLDLFVTYYGRNVLYRNRGGGASRTSPRAPACRLGGVRWGSGCSFLDYDRDGRLDLFVANYLRFDLAAAAEPGQGAELRLEGHPGELRAQGPAHRHQPALPQPRRRHLRGRLGALGRRARHRPLPDDRGRRRLRRRRLADIYVACDSTASILYRNNRDGTFTDVGAGQRRRPTASTATPQAGMGLAVGDYDRDGRLDLLKTHFADDIPALYRNLGRGLFEDARQHGRAGRAEPLRGVGRGPARPRQRRLARPRLRDRQRLPRDRAPACRSTRTAARASSSATRAAALRGRHRAQRPGRHRRPTPAAAPPSATTTTTATWTCW